MNNSSYKKFLKDIVLLSGTGGLLFGGFLFLMILYKFVTSEPANKPDLAFGIMGCLALAIFLIFVCLGVGHLLYWYKVKIKKQDPAKATQEIIDIVDDGISGGVSGF